MNHSAKFLSLVSLAVMVLGFWFLSQGNLESLDITPENTPVPIEQSKPDATNSSSLGVEGEKYLVTKVVDGDTFKLENGATVRMIGVDTPETKDPRRPVGCFGKEASAETKGLIEGKMVILQKDISETDKYQRLLRYAYLPLEDGNTLFVNDYLIREGFGKILTYPPDVKFTEQFLKAQEDAKLNNRGLWGRC